MAFSCNLHSPSSLRINPIVDEHVAVVIFKVPLRGSKRQSLGYLPTTAKRVETSVNTTNTNRPSQDYTNLDDQTCNVTPGFKSFTLISVIIDCDFTHIEIE